MPFACVLPLYGRICVPLHQGGVSVLKDQFIEALVRALFRNLRHLQSNHNQC